MFCCSVYRLLQSLERPFCNPPQRVSVSCTCMSFELLQRPFAESGAASYGNSSVPADSTSDITTTIHRTSTIRSTITVPPSPTCSGGCDFGPGDSKTWDWPGISVTSRVLATIVYQINNATNTTSTITRYNNATLLDGYTTLDNAAWSQILHTTGVTVHDGTPTLTFKTPAFTDLTGTVIVTNVIASPTGYLNYGWLYM